jgi:DNA-binding MarR family transcriptional regulator
MTRTIPVAARPSRARPNPAPASRATHAAAAPDRASADVKAALDAQAGQCICGNLRMAARLVTAFYDAALRPAGIEANQMIMLWVAHASDRMPANRLAWAAGIDQSTASRNLAVLEARGLVASVAADDDRRQRLVTLTPRGRSALYRAFPHWQKAQADLSALAADLGDLGALGRVLRKVSRRMQDR